MNYMISVLVFVKHELPIYMHVIFNEVHFSSITLNIVSIIRFY